MEEQLIGFEIAKLAKEKGFNEKTKLYSRLVVASGEYKWNNGQFGPTPLWNTEFYHAPSQSVLQKWLREEHNLHLRISTIDNNNHWEYDVIAIILSDDCNIAYDCYEQFNSYEEALEAGLRWMLNRI